MTIHNRLKEQRQIVEAAFTRYQNLFNAIRLCKDKPVTPYMKEQLKTALQKYSSAKDVLISMWVELVTAQNENINKTINQVKDEMFIRSNFKKSVQVISAVSFGLPLYLN